MQGRSQGGGGGEEEGPTNDLLRINSPPSPTQTLNREE